MGQIPQLSRARLWDPWPRTFFFAGGLSVLARGVLVLLLWLAPGLIAQAPDFAALSAQANAAREQDRLDEAVALYRKALAIRPAWAEGWWYLGTLLYDRDEYADAAAALKKAVALTPQSGNAFAMLGLCEAELGQNSEALAHLQQSRALGLDDRNLFRVTVFTEGKLLLAAGQFSKAQEILDRLAREGSNQDELVDALGEAVLGIRPSDLAPADPATKELVRKAGGAEQIAARGEVNAALEAYAKLAADAPKVHNVQFAYGRFLLANHFDDQAVAAFRREIDNTPQHLLARLGIAGILVNSDPAAGIPYAEQAQRLAPSMAEPHFLLGSLRMGTGEIDKAIAELETAKKLAPEDARIYFALGNAYAKAHRMTDAARARAEFARLSKENPQ